MKKKKNLPQISAQKKMKKFTMYRTYNHECNNIKNEKKNSRTFLFERKSIVLLKIKNEKTKQTNRFHIARTINNIDERKENFESAKLNRRFRSSKKLFENDKIFLVRNLFIFCSFR